MAELTVVGWLVSPIIKTMVDKARSFIGGQYNWQEHMREDLQKLESTLIQLQTVIAAAERRQTKDESQAALLRQLKDAVYEADDLLDDFEYQIMQARAKEAEGTVSRATSSSVKFAKRLVGRDKSHAKLRKILKKLDNVNKSADRFIQVAGLEKNSAVEQVEISSNRVTSSILPKIEIVGRTKEVDQIVSLLLKIPDEPESSYANISVITIIGVGGVGKTTLAQLIYNDHRIVDQFPLRMWICVSDNFDEIRLTREMLGYVSKSNEKHEDILNFNMLQKELQTRLQSMRFLLVLDDVWPDEKKGESQNEEMWNKVLAPLQDGARDSKILLTTRMGIVAKNFGDMNPISLEGLTKDETWSLMENYAFGNENPDNYPELKKIGMWIAERLKGSPLASKVVGSMLRDRLDAIKWMEILERETFDDVMSILRLSYQRLPDHLKKCFAYCSIFPKDWRFKAEDLVLLWIAQDYIGTPVRNDRSLVDVGMDYFNELLSRSFFQNVEQDSSRYYVIHDLMHDLAEFVSVDECYRIDHGKQRKIMEPVRHLGFIINDEGGIRDFVAQLEEISNFKNLRTLIFFGHFRMKHRNLPLTMFKDLRSLRVLDFGCLWKDNALESIGDLTHLRYLNLGDLTDSLPESLYELYHLQVLAAYEELSFCKGMSNLIRFGKLSRLDVPRLVFQVEKKRGHTIGVLKDMVVALPILGSVWIENLENVAHKEEAIEADLGSKQHLYRLVLEWGSSRRISRHDTDEEVVEALRPHPNLKWLRIKGFQGTRSPTWLESKLLINLQSIHLFYCGCLEVLPPLGHLPLLKELRIWRMNAIKQVSNNLYGVDNGGGVRGFPSLEVLEFEDMPEWSEWLEVDFPIFPRLRELRLQRLPKLMQLPLFPPTLRVIDVYDTRVIFCLQLRPLPSSSSLECFALVSSVIPSHTTLLHDNHLQAIKSLKIRDCREPMPAEGFIKLTTLKELEIHSCLRLLASKKEYDTGVLPASLESLVILESCVIDRWFSRCLQGLTLLSKLTIWNCTGLTSLPSAQVLHHLTALQKLDIQGCKELMSLGGIHSLPSLEHLVVYSCCELKSLPEEGLPTSIKKFFLGHCAVALEQQIQEEKGPEWAKVAHIPYVHIY